MVKIKICGITRQEDALLASILGADALGFNFYRQSPRYIAPVEAERIIQLLPKEIIKVGVFVNEDADVVKTIKKICGLDYIQFHGHENPLYCQQFSGYYFKAFRVSDLWSIEEIKIYSCDCYLLDTYDEKAVGGTGKQFDWDKARQAKQYGKIILAGGLTPQNLAKAIHQVEPYGVDVATGVESSPGVKDPKKLEEFIKIAKES